MGDEAVGAAGAAAGGNGNAGTSSAGSTSSGAPAAGGSGGGVGEGAGGSSTPAQTTQDTSAVGSFERVAAKMESESASSTDKLADTGEKPAGAVAKPQAAIDPKTGKPVVPSGAAGAGGEQFHLPRNKQEYDRILGNARTAAAAEVVAKQYGGATPESVREAAQLFQQIQANPKAWAQEILREEAGAGAGGATEEEDLTDPEPDYTSPDGKAQFYSKTTMATILQNMEKRLLKQMSPALTIAEKQAKQEQFNRVRGEAAKTAGEVMAVLKQDPRFEPNKAAVAQKLAAIPEETRRKVGSIAALYMAWHAVLNETVIPGLESATEKRLRTDQQRIVAGGTGGVVPGGGQQNVRKPVKDGDVDGLAKRFSELEQEMST